MNVFNHFIDFYGAETIGKLGVVCILAALMMYVWGRKA